MFWGEQGWTESRVSLAKVEVEATELDRRMPTTANHWFAFKVREGSEAKKPDSVKLQVSENVSRKREKKMIMQIYVSFVPNLTSSRAYQGISPSVSSLPLNSCNVHRWSFLLNSHVLQLQSNGSLKKKKSARMNIGSYQTLNLTIAKTLLRFLVKYF